MLAGKMRWQAGFTLLEVLVAMAILGTVTIVIVRTCGDSLTHVAASGWRDTATRFGRAKMAEVVRTGIKGNMQGTFAPLRSDLVWKATVYSERNKPGRMLEFTVSEKGNGRQQEIVLEQFLFP